MPVGPSREVGAAHLRQLFNDGRFYERAQRGELLTRTVANRHPTAPKANEPVCTRSQMVEYLDPSGDRVALVHQDLRTDGRLGASGRPDPKWVVIAGVRHRLERR
jgi:hypothetical protein